MKGELSGAYLSRTLLDNINEPYFLVDKQGVFYWANKVALQLLGVADVAGKSMHELFPKSLAEEQLATVQKVIEEKEVVKNTTDAVVDGKKRWFSTTIAPFIDGKTILAQSISIDITTQKEQEAQLKDYKITLQSIFEAAPAGIGVVKDRIIKKVSNFLCLMIGYSEEELLEKNSEILYPSKEEFERVGKIKYDLIEQFGFGAVETQFKTKSGKLIDILLSSAPLSKNNLSEGVAFTAWDITDRKKLFEQYQEMFEHTGAATVLFRDDQIIELCNKKFEKLSGMNKKEIEGNIPWTNFVSKKDIHRMLGYHKLRSANKGDPPEEYQFHFVDAYGDEKLVHLEIGLVPGINLRIASISDITNREHIEKELQASEEKYRIITEKTGHLVYDYDVHSGEIEWSGAINEITGMDEFHHNIKEWESLVHPDDVQRATHELRKAEKTCGLFDCEYRFRKADGSYIDIEEHGIFLPDELGKAGRMLGSMKDITSRKNAERELAKRNAELEQINKFAVDREVKMVELKERVKDLERQLAKQLK